MIGTRVSGATLGIIGFGRIGQAMARRAHKDCNTMAMMFEISATTSKV